jgi:hypothetical protein
MPTTSTSAASGETVAIDTATAAANRCGHRPRRRPRAAHDAAHPLTVLRSAW